MNVWERTSLFAAAALIGLPTANLLMTAVLQRNDSRVTWFLFLVTIIIGYFLVQPRIQLVILNVTQAWPLYIAGTIQLALIALLTTAFLALPDVDPYHWIKVYQTDFLTGTWDVITHRPLFYGLVHVLDVVTGHTSEGVFKYVLPVLSLATLIPAWLVARRFKNPLHQLAVMMFPSMSPALLITTHLGTPQSILNILTAYFVLFLIYAHLAGQRVWHYAAGAIMLGAVFYHGLALFLFSLWLIATLWYSRYRSLIIPLVIAVGAVSAPYILRYTPAAIEDMRINLLFPTSWKTVDGVITGWPGIVGISQYYGFHAGPMVITLLAVFLWQLVQKRVSRAQLRQAFSNPSSLVLVLIFIVFLGIAEVVPRLANIVVLPERAWLMSALASPILLTVFPRRMFESSISYLSLFVFSIVSIVGAIYVNQQKAHSIPDYVVESARWIGQNISPDKLVTSNRSPDYLDLYTKTPVKFLPNSFYCDRREQSAPDLHHALTVQVPNAQYVYLATEDREHPYANRPWHEPIEVSCLPTALESDSAYFKAVYRDSTRAGIWEVL